MRIAFQMEPMEDVNPQKNNSLTLMIAAQERGHVVFHYTPESLSLRDGQVMAFVSEVTLDMQQSPFFKESEKSYRALDDMDVIMARQDPPFDMAYVTSTYMLEYVSDAVRVINPPRAVRDAPEKFLPDLLKPYTPPTLVTREKALVQRFIKEHQDVIFKPLYLFGGQGIERLRYEDEALEDTLDEMLLNTALPVVVQRYIPEVVQGDKRILLLQGEIAGAFLRVPKEGSVRANLMAGGSLQPCEITPKEHEICQVLSPFLQEKDLHICGIDVIGDYVTEVNVTSPIGFKEIADLYGTDPAAQFWQQVEQCLA